MSGERIEADVCVIGAGAGGAVAAAELAEGGMNVVVIEEGHWHDPDTFTARPPEMLAQLYRDGGQTMTLGAPPIMLPLGSGLGGTTLINSGTCFRTPPRVLDRWARDFGLDVRRGVAAPVLRARGGGDFGERGHAGACGRQCGGGAARSGEARLVAGYLSRNARGCVGSGVCAFGCPTSAKQHTGITYIPRAEKAGARIVTGARVERVLTNDAPGGSSGQPRIATGVRARMASGVTTEVRAPTVIVAAGTINTPLLLSRSGLGGASGQLGQKPLAAPRHRGVRAYGRGRGYGAWSAPELLRG